MLNTCLWTEGYVDGYHDGKATMEELVAEAREEGFKAGYEQAKLESEGKL